jgi:glycosyltransferase involved in cell wall biosynthesis
MKICHVGIMGDIRKEGMISQYIYDYCEGEHTYWKLDNKPDLPEADIYILHCMKNLLFLEDFITFQAKGKIISLVHSSEPCMPSKYSDVVVVLTDYWQKRLWRLYDIRSIVIPGGIDLDIYTPTKRRQYQTRQLAFGKISRPEPGKFHSSWNRIILRALNEYQDAECRIICRGYEKLNFLNHDRMIWIDNVKIGDHENKIEQLSKLDVYIECHADSGSAFVDTFNMSMLEAMALGIPVLMYRGLQLPMAEVLGEKKCIADTVQMFENGLDYLLFHEYTRKVIGEKMRERAEKFSHLKMIERWNEILC